MRFSISLGALTLASLQVADALRGSVQRNLRRNAELGLYPDGTPMKSRGYFQSRALINESDESIQPEFVELDLNHFATDDDDDEGTFYNRYWVSSASYRPGGPVFLYDVGEQDAEASALSRLESDQSVFKQLVDQFNGIGIVWEHRFYGNSSPVIIDLDTPAEDFQYLTTAQALEDVKQFATQFSRENITTDLTPSGTPWVFIGGSYPGMRAAFMRKFYPDVIHASFASSAPVEARVDMSFYADAIWDGMNAYGYGNCTRDIHAAILHIDDLLEDDDSGAEIKERFFGLGAADNSNAAFADALGVLYWPWQNYGVDAGLADFCDWIEMDPETNKTAPAEGWAKTKGANFTVNRWVDYEPFLEMVNSGLDTNCSKTDDYNDCDFDLPFEDPGTISWTWQYCTEWGYFQSANIGDRQLASKFNSLEHQADVCHRQFPNASTSLLPDWPRVNETNAYFGGWDIRPSNVYWSGGEFDPWRALSPLSDLPDAPKPKAFTEPPACGEEQDVDEIFGYTLRNAEHVFDFQSDIEEGRKSQGFILEALEQWLPCFEGKNGTMKARTRSARVKATRWSA